MLRANTVVLGPQSRPPVYRMQQLPRQRVWALSMASQRAVYSIGFAVPFMSCNLIKVGPHVDVGTADAREIPFFLGTHDFLRPPTKVQVPGNASPTHSERQGAVSAPSARSSTSSKRGSPAAARCRPGLPDADSAVDDHVKSTSVIRHHARGRGVCKPLLREHTDPRVLHQLCPPQPGARACRCMVPKTVLGTTAARRTSNHRTYYACLSHTHTHRTVECPTPNLGTVRMSRCT